MSTSESARVQIENAGSSRLLAGANDVGRDMQVCAVVSPTDLQAMRAKWEQSFQENLLDLDDLVLRLPEQQQAIFMCLLSRDLHDVLERYMLHLRTIPG